MKAYERTVKQFRAEAIPKNLLQCSNVRCQGCDILRKEAVERALTFSSHSRSRKLALQCLFWAHQQCHDGHKSNLAKKKMSKQAGGLQVACQLYMTKRVVTNEARPRNRKLLVWTHLLDMQNKNSVHASRKLISCCQRVQCLQNVHASAVQAADLLCSQSPLTVFKKSFVCIELSG